MVELCVHFVWYKPATNPETTVYTQQDTEKKNLALGFLNIT